MEANFCCCWGHKGHKTALDVPLQDFLFFFPSPFYSPRIPMTPTGNRRLLNPKECALWTVQKALSSEEHSWKQNMPTAIIFHCFEFVENVAQIAVQHLLRMGWAPKECTVTEKTDIKQFDKCRLKEGHYIIVWLNCIVCIQELQQIIFFHYQVICWIFLW